MKSKILRIFLSFLTVLMVFISLPVMNASAEERKTSDGIHYKISGGEVTITNYTGNAKNLTIPSEIDGYPVKHIGRYAFRYRYSLTSVTIPSSVTSIGINAFSSCDSLTSITIPSSVTSIGESAFTGCSALERMVVDKNNPVYDSRDNCNAIIETATNTLVEGCSKTEIPKSVTSIGVCAFSGRESLTSITIPSGVTSIGGYAFDSCDSLTSITIPSSVTSIGGGAFYLCDSLANVYYEGSEEDWNGIAVEYNNSWLTYANIHFSKQSEPQSESKYELQIDTTAEPQPEKKVSTLKKILGLIGIEAILISVAVMWVFIVKKVYKNNRD